jgi:hypothetical protein
VLRPTHKKPTATNSLPIIIDIQVGKQRVILNMISKQNQRMINEKKKEKWARVERGLPMLL